MAEPKPTMNMNEFFRKLKRHLANDYLALSEQKNELEGQLVQLRADKDSRNKELFQTFGQKNVKQYFSPLNIADTPGKNNDEQLEQLKADILRTETEIERLTAKLEDIQEYLTQLDWLSKQGNNSKKGKKSKKTK